jgi:hypothetical protein
MTSLVQCGAAVCTILLSVLVRGVTQNRPYGIT